MGKKRLHIDTTNRWAYFICLIAASFSLLIPAFFNHYPLVNPDTATYLASGFKPETPFDRPITYGLIIRLLTINGSSLWLIVFMQGFIISSLIFMLIKKLVSQSHLLISLFTVVFLSLFTSLSWLVSQVQPDIFTPIGFLTLALILIDGRGARGKAALYVLFFISVAIHLSHLLLFILLLISILFLNRLFVDQNKRKQLIIKILLLSILTISSIAIMGSAISKSKHVFFTGSLLDKGVLKKYLDDKCSVNQYKICAYKDALPQSLDDFIWDENSPFYKVGGWKGTKEEFSNIDRDILTTPKYLGMFLIASSKAAMHQTITFDIGNGNGHFPPGSNVNRRIAEYFPHELAAFDLSRQNTKDLPLSFEAPNKIFTVIIILSLIVLIPVFIRWKQLSSNLKTLLLICIIGFILNCFDCATFSEVNGRYGARVIWLLPFCGLTALFSDKRYRLQP